MAFIWRGLCNVAKKAWNIAAPLLGNVASNVVSGVTGLNLKPDLSELNSKKKELDNQKSDLENEIKAIEKDFQNRSKHFSEKQRKLDETEERLLQEQDNLKRVETELKNRTRSTDNTETVTREQRKIYEEQIAEQRELLLKQVVKYERSQKQLIKNTEETNREYKEHRKRLEEDYQILKQNQFQIIHLLQTLPAIQKVKELHALTDVIMHNCKVFAEDPDAIVDETRNMQRKYALKLMEVRNIMLEGHFFPGSMRIWADAAILDLHMLGFLATKGVFGVRTVERAKNQYQDYWNKLKAAHTTHKPVTNGSDRTQEIEHLLGSQIQNFDNLMIKSMPSGGLPPALGPPQEDEFYSSSNRSLWAAGDHSDRSLSLRRWGSVRERGTRHPQSARGRELECWGDAGPSRNEERFLMMERELATLRMEMGGRSDGPGNDLWAAGDHSDRSLSLHRTMSVRERRTRHPQSARGKELECWGDAGPSRNEERFLMMERELAALRRERGGRSDGPGNDVWDGSEQEHRASRSSGSGSARHRRSSRESGRREKQRYSQDHQEHATGSNSSRNKQESQLNRQDQQRHHGGRKGPENRQLSRHTYQERHHSSSDHEESSEESSSSSDEQVSEPVSKGRSHSSKDKRENLQKRSGKRH